MADEALKVLDKIPKETNVYWLAVYLSERAHQLDRSKIGQQKTDPIKKVFEEVLQDNIRVDE